MKKTLFALLACATLVAPAMATTVTIAGLDSKYDGWSAAAIYLCGRGSTLSDEDLAEAFATAFLSDTGDYRPLFDSWALTYSAVNDYLSPAASITSNSANCYTANSVIGDEAQIGLVLLKDGWTCGSEYQLVLTNGRVSAKVEDDEQIFNIAANTEGNTVYHYVTTTGGSGTLRTDKTPEPATATLSLLALAGLAVRRRRH